MLQGFRPAADVVGLAESERETVDSQAACLLRQRFVQTANISQTPAQHYCLASRTINRLSDAAAVQAIPDAVALLLHCTTQEKQPTNSIHIQPDSPPTNCTPKNTTGAMAPEAVQTNNSPSKHSLPNQK